MTVTVQKIQGNRPRIDRKYWTTSATRQGVTPTAQTTMDPKEIEDRMAAAEALSSLGLPASFPGPIIAMPVVTILQADSAPAAEKTPSSKGRAKDRSGGKSNQRDTGRESKSRSNRGGRGRGRSSSAVETAVVTTTAPTSVALNVPQVAVPHVLPLAALPSGQLGHLTFSPVSASDPAHVQPVHAPNSMARGRRRSTKNAGKGEQTSQSQTAILQQQQQQTVLRGGPGIAFHMTGSQALESALADRTNARKGASLIPLVSVASPATGQINASDADRLPRIMPDSQTKPVAVVLPASVPLPCLPTSAPAPITGSLSETLSSLPVCVSLPSGSLGSLGLQSLPSLPNLPSLPSAIASLQLNNSGHTLMSPDSLGPEPQLSPLPRDNGEKSLPLKKRKIVDSTSPTISLVTGTPSVPVTSFCASSGPIATTGTSCLALPSSAFLPISQPSQTETANVTKVDAPSTSTTEERPDSEKQLEKPAQVVSPGPTPAALLSQVLPPAVSLQLLSEINTAITPDEDGDLPLHIAVVHENDMMVKKLIQLMGLVYRNVDRYNKQQQTPLHLAIKLAYLPGIQMLLEAGADPNLVDSSGSTSIHMAVQGRDPDCLEALLQWSKHKCDLNYRNFEGMAPLHTAVVNNDIELVKKLLDHGADINIMDGKSGRTVLFHAAEGNRKAIVELLLRRGADPEIANYAGVIPTMAAQGRSHTNVARILARAVDEGLDDGGEDMETRSSPALEIAMSEDSSDSSKPVSVEKVKGSSMADVLSDMAARVSSAQSLARGQPLPSGKDPIQLQGQTVPASGQGEGSASVAAVTSQPGLKLPAQSVLQASSVEEDGRSEKDVRPGFSDPAPAALLQKNLQQVGVGAMKDQPSVHKEMGGARLNVGPLASGTFSTDVDESGMPQASLAKVIQNLIIRAWTEKQNGGEHAEARESPRAAVTSVTGTTLPVRLSGAMSASPAIGQVSTATTASAEQGLKPVPMPLPGQSAVKVASVPAVMHTAGSSPADMAEKAGSAISTPLPSAAHAQATRPLLLFRSSPSDPSGTSGVSMELRHVTADTLLALRQSPTNSVRPNTQPSTFQHLRNFLASSGIPLPRANPSPLGNNQSTPGPNHVTAGNFGTVKVLYEPDEAADQPKDYSLKSRKDDNTSVVKLDSGPLKNWLSSKELTVETSDHSKQTPLAIKTSSSVLVGQTRSSGQDLKNPQKGKRTKSKANRSKQNTKEEKVKKESKLPQSSPAGVSSFPVHGESGIVKNEHNSRLAAKVTAENAEAQTHPMLIFTPPQNAVTERTDSWSSASAEQPMETG